MALFHSLSSNAQLHCTQHETQDSHQSVHVTCWHCSVPTGPATEQVLEKPVMETMLKRAEWNGARQMEPMEKRLVCLYVLRSRDSLLSRLIRSEKPAGTYCIFCLESIKINLLLQYHNH
ncbi:hypothetical protein AMECASPLE_028296 [Ameca splendens]|uniref:Uncharacterized protein n=1 Tax=Ameca splendens TaxID=208324 RepID=A0ABV0XUB2_9TELE